MIYSSNNTMDRALVSVILLSTVVGMCMVLCVANASAQLDFKWSVSQRKLEEAFRETGVDCTPELTVIYKKVYPFSWSSLALAVPWAVWLLRKPTCNTLAIASYVGLFFNMALFWMLFTIVASYLKNQAFYM
jgi:hypothetical protein